MTFPDDELENQSGEAADEENPFALSPEEPEAIAEPEHQ